MIFQRNLMENLTDFNEISNNLMEKLRSYADGKTVVSIQHHLNRAALDIISKVAFGMNVDSINDPNNELNSYIMNSLDGVGQIIYNPLISVRLLYNIFI